MENISEEFKSKTKFSVLSAKAKKESFKTRMSKSIAFLMSLAAVLTLGFAQDPGADRCWNFKIGAFATLGGSGKNEEIKDCSGEQFCYIARKAVNQNGQDLSATQWQYEGGCIPSGHFIFNHPGIEKSSSPSCSKQSANGRDLVCVCNSDECNSKVQLLSN